MGQNVGLDKIVVAVDGLKGILYTRYRLPRVGIGVVLVHKTALELGALSCQLLRVERYVLHTCGVGGDAREVRNPRGTAQLASAGADAAYAPRLLTRTDLLHLDAYVESLGEDLDQLAEIDTALGYVVEYGLYLVTLILHVADLHVETHLGRDLASLYHGVVFERYSLLPALDVVWFCLAVYLLVLAVEGGEARAAYLFGHHVARERYDTYVVSGRCLNGHDIAPFEIEVVDILIIRAARILEAHLVYVGGYVVGIWIQPRRLVELEAPLDLLDLEFGAAVAKTEAASHFGYMFFRTTHLYAKNLCKYMKNISHIG